MRHGDSFSQTVALVEADKSYQSIDFGTGEEFRNNLTCYISVGFAEKFKYFLYNTRI